MPKIWSRMKPSDFQDWRQHMRFTQSEAATALGLSKSTIELYERGSRRDDNRPVLIPKFIELACAQLFAEEFGAPNA